MESIGRRSERGDGSLRLRKNALRNTIDFRGKISLFAFESPIPQLPPIDAAQSNRKIINTLAHTRPRKLSAIIRRESRFAGLFASAQLVSPAPVPPRDLPRVFNGPEEFGTWAPVFSGAKTAVFVNERDLSKQPMRTVQSGT